MKIVAFDIGTSRIKSAVFTADGAMIALDSWRLDREEMPVEPAWL